MFLYICGLVFEDVIQIVMSHYQAWLVWLESIDLKSQVIAFNSSLIVKAMLFTDLHD